MNNEETKYLKFIAYCLDRENVYGICSFDEFNKQTEQLKKDGFI